MNFILVPLSHEHLDRLGDISHELRQSYFSDGSISYCLLADGQPVFAGGIVNLQWHRGEAWILPTPWFHTHIKTCYKYMVRALPTLAALGHFRRVQATCSISVSPLLFRHLGFYSEGILNAFGPNGETCHMYARLFEGHK